MSDKYTSLLARRAFLLRSVSAVLSASHPSEGTGHIVGDGIKKDELRKF
jgi:hypothetical protein